MALFESILGWVFPLRSWREQQGQDGGEDSVDSRVWGDSFARFGPQIIGRRMFDYGYPYWGENPPFHAPVFVLTHRGQEPIEKSGGTSYTFVTGGIEAAVEQARAVAGGQDVLLAGGVSIAQQALAAGLVDEVQLHVTPVLAGRGCGCSATPGRTCAASRPSAARARSTCATRCGDRSSRIIPPGPPGAPPVPQSPARPAGHTPEHDRCEFAVARCAANSHRSCSGR